MKALKLLILIFLVIGCNKPNKPNLTVIDGIKLGVDEKAFERQLGDTLRLGGRGFVREKSTPNSSNKSIILFYTTIFDLSNYAKNTKHIGLIYPISPAGTNNITGINVLIGHANADIEGSPLVVFKQDVCKGLVQEIKQMLIAKYGQPMFDSRESKFNQFYAIEGNEINKYSSRAQEKTKQTEWHTDYLTIVLFEGVTSVNGIWHPFGTWTASNGYEYKYTLGDSEYELKAGEELCQSFVFLHYELTPKAIEELKLSQPKL